jgi:sulfide:quinone oxidoreductase
MSKGRPNVVIAGGGVAGLEVLLALDALAKDRVEIVLVAPRADFIYRPLLVKEPFSLWPAERRELAPAVAAAGGSFVLQGLNEVHPDDHTVELSDGELEYDMLVVCTGAPLRPAFHNATTFPRPEPFRIDEVLDGLETGARLAFVVPPGVSWPLPVYELAMMTERRIRDQGRDVKCVVVTPEDSPLILFGEAASEAVADLLAARGIEVEAGAYVRESEQGAFETLPGGRSLDANAVIALPLITGPSVDGLPQDEHGFLPIDDHCRVRGVDAVWAAGDGTNFPIKQGGLGTQQADCAAEEIAALAGVQTDPKPFHPVLRGQLIGSEEPLNMRQDIGGGAGDGVASLDYLWWPPQKISGRYLAPWLAGDDQSDAPVPPKNLIDIEVPMPGNWYESPMSLDPYSPLPEG